MIPDSSPLREPSAPAAMSGRVRVLLLEDNADDVELIVEALERADLKPSWERVDSARTFRAALDQEPWQLILADYHLPDITGLEAFLEVRSRNLDVPFILLSGSIPDHLVFEATRAGLHDYLSKRDIQRLGAAVLRSLAQAQAQRQRQALEAALAEREELIQMVFEAEPECVSVFAPDGRLLEINQAGLRMLEGDGLPQVLGLRFGDLVVEQHRERFREVLDKALFGNSGSLEFELVTLKGTRRWMETRVASLRSRTGEVFAVLAIIRDTTTRRSYEEHLRHAHKMEAVGRLAGGIAHDFNNLLTVIMGYAEELKVGLAPTSEESQAVAEIARAAGRAAELTRQLLAFGRQQVLQARPVDPNATIRSLDRMLRTVLPEDIELRTDLGPDVLPIVIDPSQLEQVLLNLALNARDAMPGGGRITLETRRVAEAPGEGGGPALRQPHVLIRVSDTGAGMDATTRDKMFEPFFTTKPVGQGSGLGLAMVYGIVSQSQGRITVESSVGAGTAMGLFFPCVAALLPAVEEVPETGHATGGRETVLLAEDELAVRELIRHTLGRLGYRVLEAANGLQALATWAESGGRIDLLLTDVVMPGLGGRALAARLHAEDPRLPVLYISGYADDMVMREGLVEAGGSFLHKPFSEGELARRIRELLDRAGPRRPRADTGTYSGKPGEES